MQTEETQTTHLKEYVSQNKTKNAKPRGYTTFRENEQNTVALGR